MPDEQPFRQCGAIDIGRVPLDGRLFRCGLEAGHHEGPDSTRHGNWQDMGQATNPTGAGWVGRVLDDLWQQITTHDPDAWRAPDDGGRAVEPPSGQTPEVGLGYSITGRGPRPGVTSIDLSVPDMGTTGGGTMASVAEVKAALDGVQHQITEAQGALRAAIEQMNQASASLLAAVEGSGHEGVASAQAFVGTAVDKTEEAVQALQASIEAQQGYAAGL